MNYKIGDTVQYEVWDGEEGRSYGWGLVIKKAKIVSVCYKLENGEIVEASKILCLHESKSDPPTQK